MRYGEIHTNISGCRLFPAQVGILRLCRTIRGDSGAIIVIGTHAALDELRSVCAKAAGIARYTIAAPQLQIAESALSFHEVLLDDPPGRPDGREISPLL